MKIEWKVCTTHTIHSFDQVCIWILLDVIHSHIWDVHAQYTSYTILDDCSCSIAGTDPAIHILVILHTYIQYIHSLDVQYVQRVPMSADIDRPAFAAILGAWRWRPKITDRVKVAELQPWRSAESRLWQTSRCPSSWDRVISVIHVWCVTYY